jgi:hypothetical protein
VVSDVRALDGNPTHLHPNRGPNGPINGKILTVRVGARKTRSLRGSGRFGGRRKHECHVY